MNLFSSSADMTANVKAGRQEIAEQLVQYLSYDVSTGKFTWAKPPRRGVSAGLPAGFAHSHGYACIGFRGEVFYAHRVAWRMSHGKWPKLVIDHMNGDPKDNRISNLREVTQQHNTQNVRSVPKHNTTGFLGVVAAPCGRAFIAQIATKGKCKHLGRFATPEQASEAYLRAKREMHPGFLL